MPRAQPGTDNPPALDADVASLPSNAPPVADPVPATAAVTPPDPETLNLIAVITPAGGVAFLDGNDLWWFYSDGGQRVRGRWSRSGRHFAQQLMQTTPLQCQGSLDGYVQAHWVDVSPAPQNARRNPAPCAPCELVCACAMAAMW